jgi:hypothetical protein
MKSNSNLKEKNMQDTISVTQEDTQHGESHDHGHYPTARPFKRFGGRMRTLLPALLICLLVPMGHGTSVAQMSHPTVAPAQSDAQKAFEKMKSLAGSWEGSIMGMSVQLTIRVTSTGNAIMHEATGSGRPDDPITMFYVDGDRLLLTHYCDAGNRPRMVGKMSPDGKKVEFDFLDVSGSTQKGLMNHAVFTMVDANHHTEEWTYVLPGNKTLSGHADFTRTK